VRQFGGYPILPSEFKGDLETTAELPGVTLTAIGEFPIFPLPWPLRPV